MHNNHILPVIGIQDICSSHAATLPDIAVFRHEQQGAPRLQQSHKHNFYLLLAVRKGSGIHRIDFRDYPVSDHTVFFLAPGQAHNWALSPDTAGFQLLFNQHFLEALPVPSRWPYFSFSAAPVLALQPAQYILLEDELQRMEEEYRRPDGYTPQLLQYRLRLVLSLLERWYVTAYPLPGNETTHRLQQQFAALVEKHYRRHAGVQFYADQLHVSANYLNATCKKETGITAGDFIRNRLLLEARRMLALTSADISGIAYDLGFRDAAYFSRAFRRHTGQSPSDFRQESRKVPASG